MKKIKRKRSIALELTISLLLTTAVFAIITIGTAFGVIRWSDSRHHERKISESFQFLSKNLTLPVWNYDIDGIRKIGDTFAQNENVSMVEITNENNDILYRYARPIHQIQMERKKVIEFNGTTIGYVKVGFIPNLGHTYYRELLLSLLILIITLIVLALITGFFLRKTLNAPLFNLIQGMEQIAKGAYTFSDHLYDYVEFREILVQFDQMARSIRLRERELAEMNQKLSASETRFRTMAESVPCVIYRCVLDSSWTMQFMGSQIDTISGYPAVDFMGNAVRSYSSIIHPDDIELMDQLIDQAIAEKRKWIVEYRIIHADGSLRWVYEEGVPIFDEQGEVACLDGFIMDRTERRLQEEELRSLRNYLSNIIDSMPSALIGTDKEGNVTRWNSEAERITGIARDAAVGEHLTKVIPRLVYEMERVHEAMQTGEVQSDPRRVYRVAGQIRYEDVTIYPLKANGIEGAVIRLDDVTEQVRIEDMMVQSEKMLSVGGLAAGMAHEINNPLAGVMQTANVMNNRLSDAELPANRLAAEEAGTSMEAIHAFMEARGIIRMLKNIRESGTRAAEIVSNMLSFARKSDSTTSTYDVAKLLDRTIDLAGTDFDLKKKYDFRQIEIIREYEDKLPQVPCDAGKIQQVFFNILRNGAEAMQEAMEKDREKCPRFILRLAYDKPEDMVVIEIEDNGPGMDEAICKRVFEPFFTQKSVGNGTGLGLSISYFIVTENHGGRMRVVSTPGQGSKFIVKLPVNRKNG